MRNEDLSPRTWRFAVVAFIVGIGVLALKWVAYRVTGSVSLYSDALESIVNTVAAFGVFVAVRLAARPPDRNHPFGHTKAEYFAAVVEGALILFAALEILRAAGMRFSAVAPLVELPTGIAISGLATVVNSILAVVLVRAGRKYRSPALYADGKHLWADVVTTIGVVLGVALAWATGFWILDPLLAVIVAVHVLWVGFGVVRDSVGGLMDKSLPEEEMSQIRSVLESHVQSALEVHDLRSRLAAGRPFVEFHLVVPGTMTVVESHQICDKMEEAIKRLIPGASVLIHVEPDGKAKLGGPGVAQIR